MKNFNAARIAGTRRDETQTQKMQSAGKSKTNWGQGMGNQRDPQVKNEVQKVKKMDGEEEPEEEGYVKDR